MIYLDNSATTKPFDFVNRILNFYNDDLYFNPSALYKGAVDVNIAVQNSRKIIAHTLGCDAQNIFFTSGGTEGNNLAILGSVKGGKGNYVCSKAEHSAVYNCFERLAFMGKEVAYCNVKNDGTIDFEHLMNIIDENTKLVSIMHINNEVGAVNDIKGICARIKAVNPNILVHTDAVQSFGKIAINVKDINVDMLTMSAHKINGAKGVGAIYIKQPNKLAPIIFGGGQESGLRSGTENVGGIVALGEACKKTCSDMKINEQKYEKFKQTILCALSGFDGVIANGNGGANHILSLSFKGIRGEVLAHCLEQYGIYIGVGSACSSKGKVSRVLTGIGVPKDYVEGTIRVSFGCFNEQNEIEEFVSRLTNEVQKLRAFKRK